MDEQKQEGNEPLSIELEESIEFEVNNPENSDSSNQNDE